MKTHLLYNDGLTGQWVVVAQVEEGRALYFDLENRLFLVRPDGRIASLQEIRGQPESLAFPEGSGLELDPKVFGPSARRLRVEDIDLPERPSMQRLWGRLKSLLLGN